MHAACGRVVGDCAERTRSGARYAAHDRCRFYTVRHNADASSYGLWTGAGPFKEAGHRLDGGTDRRVDGINPSRRPRWRVDPPNCENGYRFDFPFESRNTIRANCDNPVRQYYLRVSVERPRQRVVLARPMAAGELISPSDLVVREVSANSAGLDNPALLIGRSLRRAIAAGEAPQPGDVEEVASVLRATTDHRAGEAIRPAGFRTELVPRSRLPAGAITRTDDLTRARLRRDVAADSVLVSDDLTDTRPVVVAKRNLMRGETIDSASLEVIEMDRRALPADHLTSIQGLEQGEMTGTVRAGEPLRASMLRPALMVRKGQTVMLTVARAGIEISIQVEALEDAKLGDQVKLRNPESGKALAGLVIGRGAVRAL